MYKISFLSVLVVLFAACSSEVEIPEEIAGLENLTVIPADTEPAHTINFNRYASYGETEDVLLGRMAGVAADHEGRVFIADRDQNVIHAFDTEGEYLSQIGREGNGPGEFANISNLITDTRFLYAYDFNKRGLNVYDLESLEYSHFITLIREDPDVEELQGTYPYRFHMRTDGTLIVGFNRPFMMNNTEDEEERTVPYYIMNEEGSVVSDKILEHRAAESLMDRDGNSFMVMTKPYGRSSLLAVGDDDRIYFAWTEDFLIKVYNAEGEYEKAIYYPYSKSPLNISEVISGYEGERQRRMIRSDNAPETWPALNSLIVDNQNRLWVSTITDDREVHDWWVIEEDGELLARFTWPENRSLLNVKNDYLYTRETDEETDLQQIVRYSIDLL